jgi:arylsulfatase A-like enzyme
VRLLALSCFCAVLALGAASTLCAQGAAKTPPTRPNLLLVVTDDQRFDQMSCAGHAVLRTPTIDRLAERGVRFTNAFVTTAVCAASRATILTGRSESGHGYTFGRAPMVEAIGKSSFPALLAAAGYRNGFVGKWGVRFEEGAIDDAFAFRRTPNPPYVVDGKPHLTDRIADLAIEFLRESKREQPFCLTVAFHAPHAQDDHPEQYLPPADLRDLYEDAEVPIPPLAENGFAALPPFLRESLGRERWHWRFDSREKQIRRTKDYWRMITGLDRALGRILTELASAGFDDDTVVIFTSDNGYFLGERGLAGKWLIYEESIRVPLIVVDPRLPTTRAGTTSPAMVLNLDLAPTLLDLAGVPRPADYEGRSLTALVRGEAVPWRADFFYEHRFDHAKIPQSIGVRGERYVYARYVREQPVYEQLFDLKEDPQQLRNLAANDAHTEILAAMRARCEELQRVR